MTIRYVRGNIPGLEGEQDIAIVEGDTHGSKWIEERRTLACDGTTMPAVLALINPGDVVIDGGAWAGDHTAPYATKASVVHAFEPLGETFACLAYNCQRIPNVVLHRQALGRSAGQIRVHQLPNLGASHVTTDACDELANVTTIDILGLVPNLIKLDVEGYELEVLRGAYHTLRMFHPKIVFEINPQWLARYEATPAMLESLLKDHDYQCVRLDTMQPWDPSDPCVQYDVLACST